MAKLSRNVERKIKQRKIFRTVVAGEEEDEVEDGDEEVGVARADYSSECRKKESKRRTVASLVMKEMRRMRSVMMEKKQRRTNFREDQKRTSATQNREILKEAVEQKKEKSFMIETRFFQIKDREGMQVLHLMRSHSLPHPH